MREIRELLSSVSERLKTLPDGYFVALIVVLVTALTIETVLLLDHVFVALRDVLWIVRIMLLIAS